MSNNDQGNLPQGWRLVELRNVVCIVNGTTPQSSTSDYWGGDIVWITPTDLGKLKEREIVTSERNITQTGFDSCGLNLVPPGTVILSSRAPIGHLGIAKTELCINQGCKALIPNADIDSDFLYFAIKKSVSALQALGSGSTFAEVSKSQVEKFEIPLPPLPEQKRIATILTERLTAVEKARKASEARLEAARALPTAYLREVFESAETKGWKSVVLGDVCEIQLGKMLSPKSKTGTNSKPYLRNANVQWNRFDLAEIAEMDFDEREAAKFSLKSGDLLVCEGGEPGRSAIWQGQLIPCYYQKALHRLRPFKNVHPYFILYRLWYGANKSEFAGNNAKTTIAHLPVVRLKKLPLSLPDIKRQEQIVDVLQARLNASANLAASIETELLNIEKLPVANLHLAFSGVL